MYKVSTYLHTIFVLSGCTRSSDGQTDRQMSIAKCHLTKLDAHKNRLRLPIFYGPQYMCATAEYTVSTKQVHKCIITPKYTVLVVKILYDVFETQTPSRLNVILFTGRLLCQIVVAVLSQVGLRIPFQHLAHSSPIFTTGQK